MLRSVTPDISRIWVTLLTLEKRDGVEDEISRTIRERRRDIATNAPR